MLSIIEKPAVYLSLFLATLIFLLYTFYDDSTSLNYKSERKYWEGFQVDQSLLLLKIFNVTLARNEEKSLNDLKFDLSDSFFKPLNLTTLDVLPNQLNGDEIFVYYAYLERRDPAGLKIRVLANGNCETTKKDDIMVYIGNGIMLPIEEIRFFSDKTCEKRSYIDCKLREVELETVVHSGPFPDEIIIIRKLSYAKVKLYKPNTNYLDAVSSCIIVPLYWYNDWLRLFISFEFWKKNKIHKILIHVHSVSSSVKVLLDHYMKQGLVEIRSWPLMPSSKGFNPNDHVFDVSHQLSMSICPTWSQTRYTTMNDVDELFYATDPKRSFKDEIHRLTHDDDNDNIGALELQHNGLGFDNLNFSNIWKLNDEKRLDFLKSAKPFSNDRPSKYIYETKFAKAPRIHSIHEFYEGKTTKELNNEGLVYLHMRGNYADASKEKRILPDFQMFSDQEILEMNVKLEGIFGKTMPDYLLPFTSPKLADCMRRSMKNWPGEECAAVSGTLCMEALKDLDDWIIAIPNDHSKYTVI